MNDASSSQPHLPGAQLVKKDTAYKIGYALAYTVGLLSVGALAVWWLQDGVFALLGKDRDYWDALQVFGALTMIRLLWMRRLSR